MTGAGNSEFVSEHTADVSQDAADNTFGATTLNTALQKAGGDAKSAFSVAFMHSKVATDVENLKLLEYLKYTDANGVERSLTLGTLNLSLIHIYPLPPKRRTVENQPYRDNKGVIV